MKRLPTHLSLPILASLFAVLLAAALATPAAAQNSRKIEDQKRVIAALEKKIADEEAQIARLKKGRAAGEERVQRLARQIGSRNQLLDETEKQAGMLREEIARKDSIAGNLSIVLDQTRAQYIAMIRESYRNYRHHNYLSYIFSSRSFSDMARRIATLRATAALREQRLRDISSLAHRIRMEQAELTARQRSLDSVSRSLEAQRRDLERDARDARAEVAQLSEKEKNALQRKTAQQQQLDAAIGTLRKLTKGNKAGASFSNKTSGLHLPVEKGRVKRYRGNMAEITGPRGANVISIYEGKVVEIKRNRITDKYDVFVAHGEYITSYANLASTFVAKGDHVAKNGRLGTIGATVDPLTLETEYKLVFGIYPPDPAQKVSAEKCFKK